MKKSKVRKSVYFSPRLASEILERAKKYHRSFSGQVTHDMDMVIERAKRTNVLVVSTPAIEDTEE